MANQREIIKNMNEENDISKACQRGEHSKCYLCNCPKCHSLVPFVMNDDNVLPTLAALKKKMEDANRE